MPKVPGLAGIIFLAALGASLAAFTARADAQQPAPPAGPGPVATQPAPPAPSPAGAPAAVPAAPPAAATTPPATPPAPSAAATGPTSAAALIPHDLSPYGMFVHADIVVQAVMIGLALASLATWTILLVKTLELIGARGSARRTLAVVAEADTLRDAAGRLRKRNAPAVRLVNAALSEADRSRGLPTEGTKERAAALLARIEARAGRAMGRGTGLLATVGSTAPFVGLFGTVWGIMNSFIGISKTNTTNLAVVAPGIAEALLATATGLVAAIPAVVIFNLFARGITGYRQILSDNATEVMRLLSRDLDRGEAPAAAVGRQAAGHQAAAE